VRQLSQGTLKKPGVPGFQPVQAFQYTQRNLPHWQLPGSVYFITWRCLTGKTLYPEERTDTQAQVENLCHQFILIDEKSTF